MKRESLVLVFFDVERDLRQEREEAIKKFKDIEKVKEGVASIKKTSMDMDDLQAYIYTTGFGNDNDYINNYLDEF